MKFKENNREWLLHGFIGETNDAHFNLFSLNLWQRDEDVIAIVDIMVFNFSLGLYLVRLPKKYTKNNFDNRCPI